MVSDTRNVRGAERLAQRIRTIRTNLQVGPLTAEIGELLLTRTLRRFDEEVDPDGRPWPELAESTERRRAYSGAMGRPKLNVSGKLRGAIQLIRGSAVGATYANTGAGVRIGVSDPSQVMKAYVHNNGWARKPGGPIKKRRFLGIGDLDIKSVDSFLRRRAQKVISES